MRFGFLRRKVMIPCDFCKTNTPVEELTLIILTTVSGDARYTKKGLSCLKCQPLRKDGKPYRLATINAISPDEFLTRI